MPVRRETKVDFFPQLSQEAGFDRSLTSASIVTTPAWHLFAMTIYSSTSCQVLSGLYSEIVLASLTVSGPRSFLNDDTVLIDHECHNSRSAIFGGIS